MRSGNKKRKHTKPENPIAQCGKRIADSRRVRYPWAMAPTIKMTKLVATAIATFVSTDKFIIFPSIMAAIRCPPFRFSLFVGHFEFQRGDGCQDEKLEVRRKT